MDNVPRAHEGPYIFGKVSLKLALSYLNGKKQCVKNRNVISMVRLLKFGVQQSSILGPILFNIFQNNLFVILSADIHNFAGDNSISTIHDAVKDPVETIELHPKAAIDWLKENNC